MTDYAASSQKQWRRHEHIGSVLSIVYFQTKFFTGDWYSLWLSCGSESHLASPWHVISTLESKIDNRIRQTQKSLSIFQVPQFCFLCVAQKENCSSLTKRVPRSCLLLLWHHRIVLWLLPLSSVWRLHELSTISCIECDESFCLQFQSKSDRNGTPLMDSSVRVWFTLHTSVSRLYSLERQCGSWLGKDVEGSTLWAFAWRDWRKPRKAQLRTTGRMAEITTQDLPDVSLKR